MPRYTLVLSPRFRRDLRQLDDTTHRRVVEALRRLQENPTSWKKLAGVKIGQRRVRVGDYRIRYDVEDNQVFLYRVRHRSESYRD